jgi:hypothetical protein
VTWCIAAFCRWTGLAKRPGPAGKALLGAVAALVSFVPFSGLSLADYLLSPAPGYSIGSMFFFVFVLSNDLFERPLLKSGDFLLFCLWNVMLSLCLFSSVLGFIGPDLYALGYDFSSLFICMALLTVLLAFLRSRIAFVFIAYIAAFDLKLLPSPNFFDYMTDGLLFLISAGVVIYYVVRKILNMPAKKQPFQGRIVGRE